MTKKENNKNQKDTSPIINSNNLEPLVSVLIPCFNAGEYIAETLDSVVAQTYTNWECIVVDDHSTDNSVKIIEEFCRQYPTKIKHYTNPRKGACAARNFAFEKSQGEFIQYLDADDLLSSNKIEQQIKLFQKHGKNIITNCRWGRFKGEPSNVKWEYQKIDHDYENPLDWLVDSWNGKGMMAQHGWLIPRRIVEKAGPWNEKLKINQDGEFFCRALMQGKMIKFCKSGKVYYRSGIKNSISQESNYSKEKLKSLLQSYKNYEKILLIEDSKKIRKGLGNNYLTYIYHYYITSPSLTEKALSYFFELGFNKTWAVGGRRFKVISQIILL